MMNNIPADILASAYAAVYAAGLAGIQAEVAVLIAAQLVVGERDRVAAHVGAARTAIKTAGDGSAESVRAAASEIVADLEAAVTTGATV